MIQGTVSVSGNTGANLYLDGEAAAIVTGEMTESTVSLTSGTPADQKIVVKAGNDESGEQISQETFASVVNQFAYDTTDYIINLGDDSLSAVLVQNTTVSPTPTPTEDPDPTPTPALS